MTFRATPWPLPAMARAFARAGEEDCPPIPLCGIIVAAPVVGTMNRRQLELAALAAADRCLKARGYIAFDEVFREMGKLDAKQWDEWRRGRVPYLERVWATRHVRSRARSAEVSAPVTSGMGIHHPGRDAPGSDGDSGFAPRPAPEGGPFPLVP